MLEESISLRNLSSDLGDMELKRTSSKLGNILIPRDVWFNRMKVKSSTQLPNRHLILHSKQASGRSPQTASLNRNSTSEMERWITSWCKILQNYTNLPKKNTESSKNPFPSSQYSSSLVCLFFSEIRTSCSSHIKLAIAPCWQWSIDGPFDGQADPTRVSVWRWRQVCSSKHSQGTGKDIKTL